MCDALSVGAGMRMAGSLMKANADQRQGEAAFFAGNASADIAERAASDALHRTALASMRVNARGAAVAAEQTIETSGSAIDPNTGSTVDLRLGTGAVTAIDREVVANDASREAYGYRLRAQQERQQAMNASAAGQSAALGEMIGAAGSFVGTVGPIISDKMVDENPVDNTLDFEGVHSPPNLSGARAFTPDDGSAGEKGAMTIGEHLANYGTYGRKLARQLEDEAALREQRRARREGRWRNGTIDLSGSDGPMTAADAARLAAGDDE